jgi:hypothetical protein
MRVTKRLLPVLLVVLAFTATSCFDIEQSLTLNKDMSGKAGFRMAIDFEPMILIMAQMDREMSGKKGAPTKEELAKAKADFLKSKKEEKSSGDFETERKNLNSKLPKGVKLLAADAKQEEMKMITSFTFGFDNPQALASIEFPKDDKKEGGDPTKKSVVDKPFSGLSVKDEGKTIVIRGAPVDPMSGVKEGAKQGAPGGGGEAGKPDPQMEEMGKMIEGAMKGLRVAWRIEAPFKVIETNATRREGNALIWEYTLESLKKIEASGGKIDPVYVKFAK